jgi:hypothetical protein
LEQAIIVVTSKTARITSTDVKYARLGVKGRTPWVLNKDAVRARG